MTAGNPWPARIPVTNDEQALALQNKMPPKATLQQRIDWHRKHQEHCAVSSGAKEPVGTFQTAEAWLKKKGTFCFW